MAKKEQRLNRDGNCDDWTGAHNVRKCVCGGGGRERERERERERQKQRLRQRQRQRPGFFVLCACARCVFWWIGRSAIAPLPPLLRAESAAVETDIFG